MLQGPPTSCSSITNYKSAYGVSVSHLAGLRRISSSRYFHSPRSVSSGLSLGMLELLELTPPLLPLSPSILLPLSSSFLIPPPFLLISRSALPFYSSPPLPFYSFPLSPSILYHPLSSLLPFYPYLLPFLPPSHTRFRGQCHEIFTTSPFSLN